MILIHGDTDYYGPQLVGVYADLESANKAIMNYLNIDTPPVWNTADVVHKGGSYHHYVRGYSSSEFYYWEITIGDNLLEIQS